MDHNATSPVRPEARAAVCDALMLEGNASSIHWFGRMSRKVIEEARESVAACIKAKPQEIVFVSGGTEANTLALNGVEVDRILVSAAEHVSVLKAGKKERILYIPVNASGVVDLEALTCLLDSCEGTTLVSVMMANNETGVIQPISEVAKIARKYNAWVHCDAAQAVGRIPVDFEALGIDMMTISSHKTGGPPGVGALVIREGIPLKSLNLGGGQERKRRAGTENIPGIAGFASAVVHSCKTLNQFAKLARWRDLLEEEASAFLPSLCIFGKEVDRLPNTSFLGQPFLESEIQLIALDMEGIAVSTGSACSSGKVSPSHVLKAMGVEDKLAGSAIRISLGWSSQEEDIDFFLKTWKKVVYRQLQKKNWLFKISSVSQSG